MVKYFHLLQRLAPFKLNLVSRYALNIIKYIAVPICSSKVGYSPAKLKNHSAQRQLGADTWIGKERDPSKIHAAPTSSYEIAVDLACLQLVYDEQGLLFSFL